MKRIPIVLSAAVAFALLAGCAGNGTNGTYYGGGYSATRSDFGYRQPYPYTGYYRYNNYDRRDGSRYYSQDPYYYDSRNRR